MKNKKFCKYFDVNKNSCSVENSDSKCIALEGKSCPDYEKYDFEQDLLNRILGLEDRVHKLEEILGFENFEVD